MVKSIFIKSLGWQPISKTKQNILMPPSNALSGVEINAEEKFLNHCFDKGRIKAFVSWFLKKYGEEKTIKLLDELKTVGFSYATKAGTSIGIDDLRIPPKKSELLGESEKLVYYTRGQYQRGDITTVEKFQRMIDSWHQTSETLKDDVVANFERTDKLNPVYMMAFSGARGNLSQVRQLVGMRGLMSDPNGQIIDYPIRSNFREGLTLTEYIISSYGARKGIVDTALRTANAGYLTRRLVDVAQHIIVSNFDCGTKRGLVVREMKEGMKTIYSLKNRLVGRVLAMDIKSGSTILATRNTEISEPLAQLIEKNQTKVFIRSPLTCETRRSVCQLCYGWTLGQGALVAIGEAVGIIAAQSIGEPGTQLTMRTFHTGGVFSGDLTDEVIATEDGIVTYSNSIPGMLIRTAQGKIAFFTKGEGEFFFSGKIQKKKYKLPPFSFLYARQNQKVFKKDLIAQISTILQQTKQRDDAEQKIYSELEGSFYNGHIDLMEKFNEYNDPSFESENWGFVWILAGKIYQHPLPISLAIKEGDYLKPQAATSQINWKLTRKGKLDLTTVTAAQRKNNQKLFIETPVFSMALKSINYKSIGYVLSTPNFDVDKKAKEKESFFLQTPLTFNKKTIYNTDPLPSMLNSDEWRPEPSSFLQWFPKETQIQNGALFQLRMLEYRNQKIKQLYLVSSNTMAKKRVEFKMNDTQLFSSSMIKKNSVLEKHTVGSKAGMTPIILESLHNLKTKTNRKFEDEHQTFYCNILYIPQSSQVLQTLCLNDRKVQTKKSFGEINSPHTVNNSQIWKNWIRVFQTKTHTNWAQEIQISNYSEQGKKIQTVFSSKTKSGLVKKTALTTNPLPSLEIESDEHHSKKATTVSLNIGEISFSSSNIQHEMLFTSLAFGGINIQNKVKEKTKSGIVKTHVLDKKIIEKLQKKLLVSQSLNERVKTKKTLKNHLTINKIFFSFFVKRISVLNNSKLILTYKINTLDNFSLKLAKNSFIESVGLNFSLSKGWVYKTSQQFSLLNSANKTIPTGKMALQNIVFDSHSINIRLLPSENVVAKPREAKAEVYWIKNKKSRFYFSPEFEKKSDSDKTLCFFEKIEEKHLEFGLSDKTRFYRNHAEQKNIECLQNSLGLYQKYHSASLNKQKVSSNLCTPFAEPVLEPARFFQIPLRTYTKNVKYATLLATLHQNSKHSQNFLNKLTSVQSNSTLKKANTFEKNSKKFFSIKKSFNFAYFILRLKTFDRFQFERTLPKISLNLNYVEGKWNLQKRINNLLIKNNKNRVLDAQPFDSVTKALTTLSQIEKNSNVKNGIAKARFAVLNSLLLLTNSSNFFQTPTFFVSTIEKRAYFLDGAKNARYLTNSMMLDLNYQIFSSQTFAKTSFLSPFRGEVLNIPQYKWSNMVNKNRFLILRQSDLTSFTVNPKGKIGLAKADQNTGINNSVTKVPSAVVKHNGKIYEVTGLKIGKLDQQAKIRLGEFFVYGDNIGDNFAIPMSGQMIHLNQNKITIRKGQPIFLSPKAILHHYTGDFVKKGQSIITLPYERLKTGDIVQGIPKVEQFFEARTTKAGKLFRDSIPNLLKGLFHHYRRRLPMHKAVRQSFYKIQQILVDGVQRVYRSQGVSIADKHIEVIVRQMTAKVKILKGGQTGFFPGEILDLEFVEDINKFLLRKITYEPLILGITRASLEADSFLAAASFQQTTKMLSRAALYSKKDFLRGLKENVILGNLIPAGTGYLVQAEELDQKKSFDR